MSYPDMYRDGSLKKRIAELEQLLEPCRLCPRECGARRLSGERGECGAGKEIEISGYGPHFGEEAPLVGRGGSGTVFFSFCNLGCVYCQNYRTSRGKDRSKTEPDELAGIFLKLKRSGCSNINLVTPSHYIPQIVEALYRASAKGLDLPLVYNCSGYEKLDTLKMLDGIVDIYMPDVKYADNDIARRYSRIEDYPAVAREALKEMQRQVGVLELDRNGTARKGLLIRHLLLPGGLAGTEEILKFIAEEISPKTWINIMDQYYPTYLAERYPEINRRISRHEYDEALVAARRISAEFRLL